MTESKYKPDSPARGEGLVRISQSPDVSFSYYVADRPAYTKRMRATEVALEIAINLSQPLHFVWPIFKDFNVWMKRFGFFWGKIPAENEGSYVYLNNKPDASDSEYGSKYIVRKAVPHRLLYFDSLPLPIAGKDGVWTGHNLMSLDESAGRTKISIFMEHSWYSETMTIEELRAVGKESLDAAIAFWRDYFVVDLIATLESKSSEIGRSKGAAE